MNLDHFNDLIIRFTEGQLADLKMWKSSSSHWGVMYRTMGNVDRAHQGVAKDLDEAARRALKDEEERP